MADGRKTTTVCEGIYHEEDGKITLAYADDNAETLLVFDKDVVQVERKGDYSLSLRLKENELTSGFLGINGGQGEISTYTHKLAYSSNKRVFLAILHYDLLFSTDPQSMKLRLSVKRI
jgi:uncharacterized beta-barrel protein YwiB (DUF1934 family)